MSAPRTVTRSGELGVMGQMVGRDSQSVAELLLSVAPLRLRRAAAEVERLELALMESEDDVTQMRYATALAEWGDAGGYDIEVTWDVVCTAALGVPYDRAKHRSLSTLSGGEQKRLVLEYLLRGPDEVLLLDEPDNYLDVPGKRWLEERLLETRKTVLFVSHDRELLARVADLVDEVKADVVYWGVVPVRAWIGGTEFTTAMFPREDTWFLPLKVAVRRAEDVDLGQVVDVRMQVGR